MIPAYITETHIAEAIRRIVHDGVPPRRRGRGYCLATNSVHLPPKYTISLAHQVAMGESLDPDRFSGGRESNGFLRRHGFEVVQCDCGGTVGTLSESRLVITLGVDLASQPKRTGTCLIRWGSTSARVESLSTGATDSDLLGLFGRAEKIGIDAPFGWPVPFTRAIHDYSTSMVWPSVEVSQLRFRRTEQVVKGRLDRWPLSVSSDRIAMTAMRAARLLSATAATGEAIDRSGGGRFVETYPAAALSIWGFPSRGYKGTKGKEVRAQLVRDFAEKTSSWLTLTKEDRSQCRASDDVFDALVAALVARAAAIDRCESIPSEDRGLATKEGWIALPQSESLDKLV